MDFKVVKGQPSPAEIAALGLVLTQLEEEAKAQRAGDTDPRNLWGRSGGRLQPDTVFNPSAFRNVRYY